MASTYTANSGIEKPGSGEQSGTWGTTTNTNFDIIDRVLSGVGAITLSGTTHTLTTSDGSSSDGHYKVLVLGGSPSGTNTITISPNDQDKAYLVHNNTSQSAIFSQGSGANATIAAGEFAWIFADGAGSGAAVTKADFVDDGSVTDAKLADAAKFASGTKMLFQQTAAPTGWTKDTTHNDKALRITSGTVGTGGSVAFETAFASQTPAGSISNSVSGSTASHTLSVSEIPSHTHTLGFNSRGSGSSQIVHEPGSGGSEINFTTDATGGGGGHTHGAGTLAVSSTFSGTAIDLDVSFVDVIICTKD